MPTINNENIAEVASFMVEFYVFGLAEKQRIDFFYSIKIALAQPNGFLNWLVFVEILFYVSLYQ